MLILASQLETARSQMAFTLGFHIILASVGVAFPALMLIANYRGLRHDDQDALLPRAALVEARCRSTPRPDRRHGDRDADPGAARVWIGSIPGHPGEMTR